MPGDAIVPTCLRLLTFRRGDICAWFEDVRRVRDPKALERSQSSSFLNNNPVNHPPLPVPPPLRWPSHTFISSVCLVSGRPGATSPR